MIDPNRTHGPALALLVLLLGLLSLTAGATEPRATAPAAAPTVLDPLPFDHADHARTLGKKGLACVDCHPVGLATPDPTAPAPGLPPAPRESCHGCHLGTLTAAPRKADRTCQTCHPNAGELIPETHGIQWTALHATEALAPGNTCSDCHARSWCVDCHDDRGPLSPSPHGPAFRATHGVEARVDPASCSSCHAAPSCTACHSQGVLPW